MKDYSLDKVNPCYRSSQSCLGGQPTIFEAPHLKIKIVGIGDGGLETIAAMIEAGVDGAEFIAIDTDGIKLQVSHAPVHLHIGKLATRSIRAEGDPAMGAKAAEESRADITQMLADADMVIIVAGFGGGTGSGAAPIIAQIAQELRVFTVAVVTRPFSVEGRRRARNAEAGIKTLSEHVETMIVIQNDHLLRDLDRHETLAGALKKADNILCQVIQAIVELVTVPGIVDLDFQDIRAILSLGRSTHIGIGTATGKERAVKAVQQALSSPLLDMNISQATGVLFCIRGGFDLALFEISEAAKLIQQSAAPEANVPFGVHLDENLGESIQIIIIAAGYEWKSALT